jgi:hypothetical protein
MRELATPAAPAAVRVAAAEAAVGPLAEAQVERRAAAPAEAPAEQVEEVPVELRVEVPAEAPRAVSPAEVEPAEPASAAELLEVAATR